MTRPSLGRYTVGLILLGALSACSGNDEPTSADTPESSGAVEPSASSTLGSATEPAAGRGLLAVHQVFGFVADPSAAASEEGHQVIPSDDGAAYEIGPVAVPGEDIAGVEAVEVVEGTWAIDVQLTAEGATRWADASRGACSRDPQMATLALVVGERVISAPQVSNCESIEVIDRVQISGSWDRAEAQAVVDSMAQSD